MMVLGVVPARGGSKRIPNKNLRPLGGIPLICHCLRTAKKATMIHRLVVSTESEAIAEVARSEDVEVLKRPLELAGDNIPTLPVIVHAIRDLESRGFRADVILTVQPTYPFLTKENIEKTVNAFQLKRNIDSATTVSRASFRVHPYNARKINKDGTISFMFAEKKSKCPNSQAAPPVYFFGNLYASKRETIMDKGSLYGDRSFPVPIDPIEAFDIDDHFDMELAELLYAKREK